MKEYGDYPEIHDYTTIGEGDHIVAIRNGFTTVLTGVVAKAAGEWSGPTLHGLGFSLEASGWTFRMIQKAWRAPQDSGWYVSAEGFRSHGYGSSIHIYRLDPHGQWWRTVGLANGWTAIAQKGLPKDLRKLDFQDE